MKVSPAVKSNVDAQMCTDNETSAVKLCAILRTTRGSDGSGIHNFTLRNLSRPKNVHIHLGQPNSSH